MKPEERSPKLYGDDHLRHIAGDQGRYLVTIPEDNTTKEETINGQETET